MPIQGRPIGAPHLVLVLQNLLKKRTQREKKLTKNTVRSWGHLTYTTSGGSAQHRDEGRLSIKKRSWRNALKPSASYSESWTPPELSQGPEVENMERLFKKEKGENMFRLAYDTEWDVFELALTRWWSLHSLLTWCKRQFTFTPAVQRASSLEYASTLVSSLIVHDTSTRNLFRKFRITTPRIEYGIFEIFDDPKLPFLYWPVEPVIHCGSEMLMLRKFDGNCFVNLERNQSTNCFPKI
ncbi:hypothetical protein J3Q64DRAFT_1818650 [Phycomyces blakesleeanus]|uniref:Uncharacterized protein n=1 Tax=Phycomyces blakesleeanus TaxID=4837 RepID=A0ABR3B8T3_PHYBL